MVSAPRRKGSGWVDSPAASRPIADRQISACTRRRFSIRSPSGTISSRPAPKPTCVRVTIRPAAVAGMPSDAAIGPTIGWE